MKRHERPPRTSKTGYVYLVDHRETKQTKLGCAKDIRRRFRSLETIVPGTVVLIYAVPTKDRYAAEARVARKFRHYKMRGEWYAFPDSEHEAVIKAVGDAAKGINING